MLLKMVINGYNLLLAIGAFYLGVTMVLGGGLFESFPPEWVGVLPFNNWASLALFGMLVFGLGNGIAAVYGVIRKDTSLFILTFVMGVLFFLCTVIPKMILGEWYLPTAMFFVASVVQIGLAVIGLASESIKAFRRKRMLLR